MNSLVQDLLDYGRVSRVNFPLEPVRVVDAVTQAATQFSKSERGQLSIDVPGEYCVRAHLQVLSQVIYNLISNAFKFQEKGAIPEVRVKAEMRDGVIRLSVKDNGIGIAPNHHERIWNVFERLHGRESFPGTGIGLAIVKRAVGRMHGSYGLDSDVGLGSTFWIDLPAADSKSTSEEIKNA